MIFIGFTTSLKADSPLTSTDLTKGYETSKWVIEAKANNGAITNGIMEFLANKGDIGEKVATICQLGWGENAGLNASQFMLYLMENKKVETQTGDDYCCVAYLSALGNYFDANDALKDAEKAVKMNPKSFTVQIIRALIQAQALMDSPSNWCQVYKVCDEVRNNKSLKQDLAAASVAGIFDYINIYKEECK